MRRTVNGKGVVSHPVSRRRTGTVSGPRQLYITVRAILLHIPVPGGSGMRQRRKMAEEGHGLWTLSGSVDGLYTLFRMVQPPFQPVP